MSFVFAIGQQVDEKDCRPVGRDCNTKASMNIINTNMYSSQSKC